MNKLLILILSVVCLSSSYHVSSIAAEPAVSIGVWCSVIDVSGEGTIIIPGVSLDTDSQNNNRHEVCKGDIINPTGKVIHWNADNVKIGEPTCKSSDGTRTTMDWHETISASGQVTMICHFKD